MKGFYYSLNYGSITIRIIFTASITLKRTVKDLCYVIYKVLLAKHLI